jgi:hypothetical protein
MDHTHWVWVLQLRLGLNGSLTWGWVEIAIRVQWITFDGQQIPLSFKYKCNDCCLSGSFGDQFMGGLFCFVLFCFLEVAKAQIGGRGGRRLMGVNCVQFPKQILEHNLWCNCDNLCKTANIIIEQKTKSLGCLYSVVVLLWIAKHTLVNQLTLPDWSKYWGFF